MAQVRKLFGRAFEIRPDRPVGIWPSRSSSGIVVVSVFAGETGSKVRGEE